MVCNNCGSDLNDDDCSFSTRSSTYFTEESSKEVLVYRMEGDCNRCGFITQLEDENFPDMELLNITLEEEHTNEQESRTGFRRFR